MVLCRWLAALIRHQGSPLPGSIPSLSLLGGRGMRGPQDGGNVTVRTTATSGTLSPKKKKKRKKGRRGRKKLSMSIAGSAIDFLSH